MYKVVKYTLTREAGVFALKQACRVHYSSIALKTRGSNSNPIAFVIYTIFTIFLSQFSLLSEDSWNMMDLVMFSCKQNTNKI